LSVIVRPPAVIADEVQAKSSPEAKARVVATALASGAAPVFVVLGHDAHRVRAALRGCKVHFVDNPAYAEGMSTSLRQGLAALPADADGAVILLGDMPRIRGDHLRKLFAAFAPRDGAAICVPSYDGRWGNPVVFGRQFFAEIQTLSGDAGARAIVQEHAEAVVEVAMQDDAVLLDIDTPEALQALAKS